MTPNDDISQQPLDLVPLPGSERPPAPGVTPAAAPSTPRSDDGGDVQATVVIRRRRDGETGEAGDSAASAWVLDPESFAARFGADPDDLALVTTTFEALGLTVLSADAASRRIRISGSYATVGRVFGTALSLATSDGPSGRVTHRHRTGGLSIPAALDGVVTAVLGLDDRPQARAQFRIAPAQAAVRSFTPPELGEVYRFPSGTDGSGQTIAIIELGGGFAQEDLDSYFGGLGIPTPSVSAVGVDGGANQPEGNPNGADGEVLLDIEVAGGLSPAATILVYFAPNTDDGFLDAVATAAHASPAPAAISISWGQSEDQWTAQARTAFDDALADAGMLGVTVTAAAGDNGSSDGETDGRDHTDFPASSPHALACGGTSLTATGTTATAEVVWNGGSGGGATGGGVSDVFELPTWQQSAGVPVKSGAGGRGVPDVAANADPATGYRVLVDGSAQVYGGTSAVAPLWAALIARLVQALGTPLGVVQPRLYGLSAGFRDVTEGDNGNYSARAGWDPCTGLGVPDGEQLLEHLRG